MELTQRNIGRLFRMPLPELVCRGKQETFKLVDRVRARAATTSEFQRKSGRLARFISNNATLFFEGAFDAGVPESLQVSNADECQSILITAHHALRGKFNLLGYRALEFGDPIDWRLDPVAQRRAPDLHWSLLKPLDPLQVGDSKVIWELNRHQWLVHLAQAWRLTGDHRYAAAVVRSIQAWLRKNPTGIGINWASSLEVAFRLVAWSWALLLIRDADVLTPDAFADIENAAEAHATHVERYLSYYFSPNTHLTGEAVGLFYAGVVFSELRHADRWRSLGARILNHEIERQVFADGIYFERSTCYQRYTADIYLHYVILAARAGIEVPAVVTERLKSLLDALVALRLPDGSVPHIGDADDGMLLPLSIASPNDYRATFCTAALVFGDATYAWAAGRLVSDSLWLLGTKAVKSFEDLEPHPPSTPATRIFPVGGLATMRSGWDENAHALVFDAGALGTHCGTGHSHADLLSIQCSVFGEPYLVDAGTCCYTADSELRDYFRSTAAHSTIAIDALSQAQPEGPFKWKNRCAAHLLQWRKHPGLTLVDAIHDGYKRLPDAVTHRRRVAFVDSRYWVVLDELCGKDVHGIDVRFQFAPVNVEIDRDDWIRATRDNKRGLLLRAFASAPMSVSMRRGQREPMEGWVSSKYGCMEPAPAAVFHAETRLPLRVLTVLWPAEDIHEYPSLTIVHDAKGRIGGLRTESETVTFDDDEIYVRHSWNH